MPNLMSKPVSSNPSHVSEPVLDSKSNLVSEPVLEISETPNLALENVRFDNGEVYSRKKIIVPESVQV